MPVGKRVLQPCGTRAAARRHTRNKEDLCGPCAEAEHRRETERYWLRKAPWLLYEKCPWLTEEDDAP
jgi:hypothetical protein